MNYQIKTPNPNYNGTTLGIKFKNGLGETDNEVTKNILVLEYGYEEVVPLDKKSISKSINKKDSDKE